MGISKLNRKRYEIYKVAKEIKESANIKKINRLDAVGLKKSLTINSV